MRTVPRFAALAAAVAALGGCYSNYTLRSAPTAERQVTVTLTDAGSRELAPSLGAGVQLIDGRVVSASADALVMDVVRLVHQDESATRWHGERVTVPMHAVEMVEGRRFSVVRTAVLAGGLVTLVYLLGRSFSLDIPPDY